MWTENVKFTDFPEHFESSITRTVQTLVTQHLGSEAFTIHTLMGHPGLSVVSSLWTLGHTDDRDEE